MFSQNVGDGTRGKEARSSGLMLFKSLSYFALTTASTSFKSSVVNVVRSDFRSLMTTQRTTIDLRLAALYDIPAPQIDGFGQVWLDPSGGRRGLLGQAGILAMHSHASTTSATLS